MPIYEYECSLCQDSFEFLQKISEPVKTECPVCKQDSLKKKVTAAAFRLKGGGWYETDFKTGAKRNLAGAREEGPKDSVAKNSDAKADTATSNSTKDTN